MIDANNEHHNKNQLSMMSLSDNSLVSQYKDLIREQDMQIQKLNQVNESLAKENQDLKVLSKFTFRKINNCTYNILSMLSFNNTAADPNAGTSIDCQSSTRPKFST